MVAIALMSISNVLAKTDVTATYMTNAGLQSLDGWILAGTKNMGDGTSYYQDWKTDGDVSVIEFYHSWHWDSNVVGTPIGNSKTFRFSQKVTLPAGYYRLAVNAFYREGNGNGTNTKAYIFAGEKKQYVVGLPSSGVGAYSGSNDLYKAANAFSKGDFSNEFDFSVSEETEIEIGFDGYIDTYCSWCILGPVTLWEYTAEDYMKDYTDQVTIAEGLYGSKMNKDVFSALQEAAGKESTLVTVDDVTEAVKELKATISTARASIADYEAIAAINAKVALLDAAGQAVYQPFLDAYNAGTLTNGDIASVENAYIEAFWAMTTYPPNPNTDMTLYIINPSFELGWDEGWYSDNGGNVSNNGNFGAAKGSFFVEKWTQAPGTLTNGTLLQEISGLPNGKYKVTAELQNREQGNGNAAGRGFFLVANSDRTEAVTNNGETIEVSTIVMDGSLTIGVQIEDCTGNWVCCDNFQLIFERELVASDQEESLAEALGRAGELNGKIPTDAYSELQTTVTSYNKSYDTIEGYKNAINEIDAATAAKRPLVAPYATWKELKAAADAIVLKTGNTKLQDKFTAFEAGVEAATDYATLTQFISWAQDLLNAYNDWMALKGKADILKEVANDNETANTQFKSDIDSQTLTAVSALDEANPAQAIAMVGAATNALREAMVTYVGAANPLGEGAKFDLTWMLTNPDLTPWWKGEFGVADDYQYWGVQPDGWKSERSYGNFQVMTNPSAVNGDKGIFMEYYMDNWNLTADYDCFNIYINQNLPVGTYTLSCYAFATEAGYLSGNMSSAVFFYANDTQGSRITSNKLELAEISFINEVKQDVKIGLKSLEGNTCNWMGIGYVELYKVPGSTTKYAIAEGEVTDGLNVDVTVDDATVTESLALKTVTLTMAEKDAYLTVAVIDENDNPIDVANPEAGVYTFQMPASDVTYSVTAPIDNVKLAIKRSAGWGTFMSTFDFPIDNTEVKAYKVLTITGYQLDLTEVEGGEIPANIPVLVQLLKEGTDDFEQEISYFRTKKNSIYGYRAGLLNGVVFPTVPPVGSYVMQQLDGKVNFYIVEEDFTKPVPAFRAYLEMPYYYGIKTYFLPDGEDVATEITGIDVLTSGDYDAIYTPAGVKVDALQKGLNIIVKGENSYKIFVK